MMLLLCCCLNMPALGSAIDNRVHVPNSRSRTPQRARQELARWDPSCRGGLVVSGLGLVFDGVFQNTNGSFYTRATRVPPAYDILDVLLGFGGSTVADGWVFVNRTACAVDGTRGDSRCLGSGPVLGQCKDGCPRGRHWPAKGSFAGIWEVSVGGTVRNATVQCCQAAAAQCTDCTYETCRYFSECATPDNPLAKQCCEKKPYGLSFCGCRSKLPECCDGTSQPLPGC